MEPIKQKYYWAECKCGRNWYWKSRFDACEQCVPEQYFERFYHAVSRHHKTLLNSNNLFNTEIDHIVPKWYLLQNNVPVLEGCSVDNLQLLSRADNSWRPRMRK